MLMTLAYEIRAADYANLADRQALLALLDAYACDPMGGAQPLSEAVKTRLCDALGAFNGARSWLAWHGSQPVGLLNAFLGFSTFKAAPLLNIHDLVVQPAWHGQGIGRALLAQAEHEAKAMGCCKLTLEVLSGNQRAQRAYAFFGFEHYVLDPQAGQAGLMQKWL
jgi:GNAT superfamily N-acetyltransferase